jgi:hypothetical protein
MRGKLPDTIKLPASVTVPFGAFEEALNQKENRDIKKQLEAAVKAIPDSHAEDKLQACRDLVMQVLSPPNASDCGARVHSVVCAAPRSGAGVLNSTPGKATMGVCMAGRQGSAPRFV